MKTHIQYSEIIEFLHDFIKKSPPEAGEVAKEIINHISFKLVEDNSKGINSDLILITHWEAGLKPFDKDKAPASVYFGEGKIAPVSTPDQHYYLLPRFLDLLRASDCEREKGVNNLIPFVVFFGVVDNVDKAMIRYVLWDMDSGSEKWVCGYLRGLEVAIHIERVREYFRQRGDKKE
jgi:hypothetical protein